MKSTYKWQGDPVKVEFGNYHALPSPAPLMWYNFEIQDGSNMSENGSRAIPAIRFKYKGDVHVIANHFGIGAHKLKHGGWPSHTHFTFGAGFFREGEDYFTCKVLREKEYAEHEARREVWMKQADPTEYARIVKLRKLAKSILSQGRPTK